MVTDYRVPEIFVELKCVRHHTFRRCTLRHPKVIFVRICGQLFLDKLGPVPFPTAQEQLAITQKTAEMIKRYPHAKQQGLLGFFSSLFDRSNPQKNLVNRPPRISLNRLHAVSFDMDVPYKQSGLGVANISLTGIGFLASHSQWPQSGDTVHGTLNILQAKLPTTLRVVHVTSVIAGCHFSVIGQEYSEILSHFFDAELDAIQLQKVNPAYLKKDPDGTAIWFKGLDTSELYIVHRENRIVSFSITFLGNTIRWSESSDSPQYGIPQHSSEESAHFFSPSDATTPSLHDPAELNTTAIKFIHNIKGLNSGFTDQIKKVLHENRIL